MATRNIVPRASGEGGIGTAAKKWLYGYFEKIYLDNFAIEGTEFAPLTDDTSTLGKIGSRFSEVHAVKFVGTASEALYADLAEKFLTREPAKEIPEGTVLSVSESAKYDAQICQEDCCDHVIGVISLKPAYTMNNELSGGTSICVKGRVPVRIIGPIRKRQVLVAAGNGTARAVENYNEKMDKIGYALHSDETMTEKLVECFIV